MSQHSFPKEKIRIVLLEGVHPNAEKNFRDAGYSQVLRLKHAPTGEELTAILEDAHIVGIRSRTQLSEDALAHARRLFAVGCFCIGTNQVDLSVCASRGIPVFNAPHSNTRSVAELVVGWVIMLMRGVFQKSQAAHRGQWLKTVSGATEVRGKTIGIIGYGHIGSQVSILAEAMGMNVQFFDIEAKLPLGNARATGSLRQLMATSDIITLHVPETDQTTLMIDAETLAHCRPGTFLINASRGKVVDIEALAECIHDGRIRGAAVDVFPTEPKSTDDEFISPLRGLDNVILTPHIGGSTLEAQENIGTEVAGKLVQYSDFGSTQGAVNFPQLTLAPHRNAHRILHIHRNVPGVLRQITRLIADENINIVGQHLQTSGDLGYVVFDVEGEAPANLLADLKSVDATIRARILY